MFDARTFRGRPLVLICLVFASPKRGQCFQHGFPQSACALSRRWAHDDSAKGEDDRGPCPIPHLAAQGVKRETREEYVKRRAATVARHGGDPDKPETPEQFNARKLRTNKEYEKVRQRIERYESGCRDPLPGRALEDISVGDVLEGTLLSEIKGKVDGGKKAPKAWFDVNVWRRRTKDKYPISVSGMVRLYQEDLNELSYFNNNKGVPMRLFAVDVQVASGRLVVSFTPPDLPRYGRKGGGVLARRRAPQTEPREGQLLLEDLEPGQPLRGATVQQMTPHAAYLQVPVLRRAGGGSLVPVNARLHKRDLDATTVLQSAVVRSEDVARVVVKGEMLTAFVKAAYPNSGKLDVMLTAAVPDKSDMRAAALEAKRAERRRYRRAKVTRRLLELAAKAPEEILTDNQSLRVGTVVRVQQYGLFVDVGASVNGLVHISDLAKADWDGKREGYQYGDRGVFVEDITSLVPVGQRLKVRLKPSDGPSDIPRLSFEVAYWIGGRPSEGDPSDGGAAGSSGVVDQEDDVDYDGDEEEEYIDEEDKWERLLGYDDEQY